MGSMLSARIRIMTVRRVGALALLSLLSMPAIAVDVIGIADGDTLTVLLNGRPARIRLANIDAPEERQAFGSLARDSLAKLCHREAAVVNVVSTDRYGRAVALVSCAGINVNRAQVERGLAWVDTRYNQDAAMPALQKVAMARRRGLWSQARPIPPWEFRRRPAVAAPGKSSW